MSGKCSFFNTLSRSLDEFIPQSAGTVKMYTCGPTVYDYAHIGNFRTYTFEDLLRRVLKYMGYRVIQVMNITDIDDKIIRASQKEGVRLEEFTKKYLEAFFEDIERLNIEKAEFYPKATGHIPEMVSIIRGLIDQGFAYKGEDGSHYFSIARFPGYGMLSRINKEELKVGVRVKLDEYEKETASDFALWKAWDRDDGEIFWDVELGRGRPGWHIECSAMSMKYLGEQFDIHTGGVDNIFPHHENEIAQSEAFTGKKFVNYWLHSEHLLVDNRKMSKSLGNFFTLRDLMERGHSPLSLRYLYISTHYRSKLNFTLQALAAAQNTIQGILDFLERLQHLPDSASSPVKVDMLIDKTRHEFEEKISEDLNTPLALASLFTLITEVNRHMDNNSIISSEGDKLLRFFFKVDEILGLNLQQSLQKADIAAEDRNLISEREEARRNRNFKRADEIRQILSAKGIVLQDTAAGTLWKKNQQM